MASSSAAVVAFRWYSPFHLRQELETHPGLIGKLDAEGSTALSAASTYITDVGLVQWMIEVHGADVNARTRAGATGGEKYDSSSRQKKRERHEARHSRTSMSAKRLLITPARPY